MLHNEVPHGGVDLYVDCTLDGSSIKDNTSLYEYQHISAPVEPVLACLVHTAYLNICVVKILDFARVCTIIIPDDAVLPNQ